MDVKWRNGDPVSSMIHSRDVSLNGVQVMHNEVLAGDLAEHEAPAHEINITMAGHLRVEKQGSGVENCGYKTECGTVCVTPFGQSMKASWDEKIEVVTIWFEPKMIARVAAENGFSDGFEIKDSRREKDSIVEHLGLSLIQSATAVGPVDRLYSDTLANTLAVHLLKNYSTAITGQLIKGGLTGYRLKQVTDYINDNLEQDIALAELAAVAGLSRFHFTRAFRKSTGLTPRNYLMEKRVERAKHLLSSSNIPIVEVSLMTGFKNQSHFTSLFRRLTHITPRIWRQIEQG